MAVKLLKVCIGIVLACLASMVDFGVSHKQPTMSKVKQVEKSLQVKLLRRNLNILTNVGKIQANAGKSNISEDCNIGVVSPVLESCLAQFPSFEDIGFNIDVESICSAMDLVVSSAISCIENIAVNNSACTPYTDMFISGIDEAMHMLSNFIDCREAYVDENESSEDYYSGSSDGNEYDGYDTCDTNSAFQDLNDCTADMNDFPADTINETCRNFENAVISSLGCLTEYESENPECEIYTEMFYDAVLDAVKIMDICDVHLPGPEEVKCNLDVALSDFAECMDVFGNQDQPHNIQDMCLNLTDTVAEVRACIYEAYEDHPDCVSHLDPQTEAISATIGNIWEQCEPLYSYSGIEGYEYENECSPSIDQFSACTDEFAQAVDIEQDENMEEMCRILNTAIDRAKSCLSDVYGGNDDCSREYDAFVTGIDQAAGSIDSVCSN